jgi:hypothetical protein
VAPATRGAFTGDGEVADTRWFLGATLKVERIVMAVSLPLWHRTMISPVAGL